MYYGILIFKSGLETGLEFPKVKIPVLRLPHLSLGPKLSHSSGARAQHCSFQPVQPTLPAVANFQRFHPTRNPRGPVSIEKRDVSFATTAWIHRQAIQSALQTLRHAILSRFFLHATAFALPLGPFSHFFFPHWHTAPSTFALSSLSLSLCLLCTKSPSYPHCSQPRAHRIASHHIASHRNSIHPAHSSISTVALSSVRSSLDATQSFKSHFSRSSTIDFPVLSTAESDLPPPPPTFIDTSINRRRAASQFGS